MSNLHVIAGSGPLGQWTARALLGMGRQVRMINRSGTAADAPAGVEVVRGDLSDGAQARELLRGAAAVYQCAQPAYHRWITEFPPLQDAVLAGARAAGARLVLAENLYMYGDPQGAVLTETTPYRAHTRKGRLRRTLTERAFAAQQRGELEVTAARGSDFFGPYDLLCAEQHYQPALAGSTVNVLGRIDRPHTLTYVADFGRALAVLGTDARAVGRAWHVPSAAALTLAQYFALIEQAIGRTVTLRPAGRAILTLLGLFNPNIRELPEMLYQFERPFVMDSSAFSTTFGVQPTPLSESVAATAAWAAALPRH